MRVKLACFRLQSDWQRLVCREYFLNRNLGFQACQRYWNSSIEWKAINRKRRLSLWLSKCSLRNFSFDNIFVHVVTERWKTSGELFSSRRRSRIFVRVSVSTEVVKLMYVSCYTNCKHVMRVTYLFIGNCILYPRRERLEI